MHGLDAGKSQHYKVVIVQVTIICAALLGLFAGRFNQRVRSCTRTRTSKRRYRILVAMIIVVMIGTAYVAIGDDCNDRTRYERELLPERVATALPQLRGHQDKTTAAEDDSLIQGYVSKCSLY